MADGTTTTAALEGATASATRTTTAVKTLSQSLESLSRAGIETGNGLGLLTDGIAGTAKSIADLTGQMESIARAVPLLGGIAAAPLNVVKNVVSAMGSATRIASEAVQGYINALDSFSKPIRELEGGMWDLEKAFGGTFDTARSFYEVFNTEVTSGFAADMYLSGESLLEMSKATMGTSIRMSDLADTMHVGGRATTAWSVATAHATAIGMTAASYMTHLNTSMNTYGMSTEGAIEQMAMYNQVASETGLNTDKVSSTLEGAARRFEKLGMSANFGRPFLEGFAQSVTNVGLGIENAMGLTQSFSGAIGKLTQDYGLAYVTFQRGGLEMGGSGGSGVLGASIGLRADMLNAERDGDQGAMAHTLAQGMRDTIASFTGGDIVTLTDADNDSSKANAYYMQEQLLMSQYGMGQDDASRTLEMLSELDDARRSGDSGAAAALEAQLSESRTAVDETLDETKKISLHTGRLVAFAQIAQLKTIRDLRDRAGLDGTVVMNAMTGMLGRVTDHLSQGNDAGNTAAIEANNSWDSMNDISARFLDLNEADGMNTAERGTVTSSLETLGAIDTRGMSTEERRMLNSLKDRAEKYKTDWTTHDSANNKTAASYDPVTPTGGRQGGGSNASLASSMNRLSRALENQPQRVVVTPAGGLLALVEASGVVAGGTPG
jgi:uncharacterized protein YdbL (DUF1318 family)